MAHGATGTLVGSALQRVERADSRPRRSTAEAGIFAFH
jgi:hypothetical protein